MLRKICRSVYDTVELVAKKKEHRDKINDKRATIE